jgi:hypothetical protein
VNLCVRDYLVRLIWLCIEQILLRIEQESEWKDDKHTVGDRSMHNTQVINLPLTQTTAINVVTTNDLNSLGHDCIIS